MFTKDDCLTLRLESGDWRAMSWIVGWLLLNFQAVQSVTVIIICRIAILYCEKCAMKNVMATIIKCAKISWFKHHSGKCQELVGEVSEQLTANCWDSSRQSPPPSSHLFLLILLLQHLHLIFFYISFLICLNFSSSFIS